MWHFGNQAIFGYPQRRFWIEHDEYALKSTGDEVRVSNHDSGSNSRRKFNADKIASSKIQAIGLDRAGKDNICWTDKCAVPEGLTLNNGRLFGLKQFGDHDNLISNGVEFPIYRHASNISALAARLRHWFILRPVITE